MNVYTNRKTCNGKHEPKMLSQLHGGDGRVIGVHQTCSVLDYFFSGSKDPGSHCTTPKIKSNFVCARALSSFRYHIMLAPAVIVAV